MESSHTEKGLIVNSGAGNDTIDILDLYVDGTGTIEGDAGDDTINLYNPDLPAGAFQLSYSSTSLFAHRRGCR